MYATRLTVYIILFILCLFKSHTSTLAFTILPSSTFYRGGNPIANPIAPIAYPIAPIANPITNQGINQPNNHHNPNTHAQRTSTYALRSSISPALPIAGGSATAGAIASTGASIEGIAVSLDSPLISHTFNARVNPVQRGLGVTAGLKVLARTAVNLAVVYAAVMIVVLVKERVAAASSGGEDGVPSAVGVGVPGLTGASASLRLACGAVRSRSLKVLSVLLSPLAGLKPSLNHYARLAWGGLARARDGYLARTRVPCPPMDIKGDDWGVATLVAKEEAGGGGGSGIRPFAS